MARRKGGSVRGPWLTDEDRAVLQRLSDTEFLAPMDVGGTDGSHHSGTLHRLTRLGLVEQRRSAGHIRPSYKYRRVPILSRLIEFTNRYAAVGCAGIDQPLDATTLCGKCGCCEAAEFLRITGLALAS